MSQDLVITSPATEVGKELVVDIVDETVNQTSLTLGRAIKTVNPGGIEPIDRARHELIEKMAQALFRNERRFKNDIDQMRILAAEVLSAVAYRS